MRSITENFNIILDIQTQIGYDYKSVLLTPADEFAIKKTEAALNMRFSKEMRELYSFANGTKSWSDATDSEKRTCMIGLMPFWIFLNLSDAETYYWTSAKDLYQRDDRYENWFQMWDSDFIPGKNLFPLMQDGSGDCYWLDLNEDSEHYGKIYYTTTLVDSPDYAFTSLTSMFQTIAECYEQKVFSFSIEENLLKEDYGKFGIIARKNNPELKDYWDNYLYGD